jgi:hypothetical protein
MLFILCKLQAMEGPKNDFHRVGGVGGTWFSGQ